MVGEACLPSNAYCPRTPDYTLYSGVHVCWSEYSDSSFVYGFMSLDYGLGTMTATFLFGIVVTRSGPFCVLQKKYACNDFSTQFRKISLRYKTIGYNINVIRQTACMVVNPITVNNFASPFNCTPAG